MVKKEFNGKVRVDAKIEAMIPPLRDDQMQTLEESLLAEGKAISPLWMWGDLLVDGHNRFRICKQHKLPYNLIQVYEDAVDIEDVKDRIRRDSLARRHMTPGEQSKLRAERVEYKINNGATLGAAIRAVAEESSVSPRQVRRDVKRAELINNLDDDLKQAANAVSTPVVKKLASMSEAKQKAIAKKAGGDSKEIEKVIKKQTPGEAANKVKSIANQHRDKLVRAIDDYHELKPKANERDRLIKVVQSISLW